MRQKSQHIESYAYQGWGTSSLQSFLRVRELLRSTARHASFALRIDTDEVCAHRPEPGRALVVDRRSLELRRAQPTDRVRCRFEPSGKPGSCRADRLRR